LLVTSLIFLAAGQTDAAAVANRFQAFMTAHPALSADCVISGSGRQGTGEITIRRPVGAGVKVDWIAKFDPYVYRFETDGSMGIETISPAAVYDRLPAVHRPYPAGRMVNAFGYPSPLVAGNARMFLIAAKTTMTQKDGITELIFTDRSPRGDTVIVGDVAADGRLIKYDSATGSPGHMSHQIIEFSNYKFDAAATASAFDTRPPVGYSAYAFDVPPDVLPGDAPLPAVPLSGAQPTNLAKLGNQPKVLLAFIDDPMPEGLVDSLGRLNRKTPVVFIALKGADVKVGRFPLYRTDDAGFDAAGIRATPQFYFVSQGKVVQAWSGFRESAAAKFEAEVLNCVQKP